MSKAWCKTTIEPGVSPEAASLSLWGRGKAVYILPSSDPTIALLLVGYTEYDDDDDDDDERKDAFRFPLLQKHSQIPPNFINLPFSFKVW